MDRGIPRVKRIGEVKQVSDLAEGEKAVAESDLVYTIKSKSKVPPHLNIVVEYVVRVDSKLYPVSEEGGLYSPINNINELNVYNKKFYRARIEKRKKNPLGYIPKPH